MKIFNRIFYLMGIVMILSIFASCKKSFLDRPPLSAITDVNFYKTDDQVRAGTAPLYNAVWFDYNDQAAWQIGDFRGGDAYDAWYDNTNVKFNTTPDNQHNGSAWRSFFNVVAQSNLAILNINRYATSGVSESVKKGAIAEARFMRALAYRYLVSNWGPVPIIENNFEHLNDTLIRRNTVSSVWRFITREMREAAVDLPAAPSQQGRVSKWAAEAMLARFYLTRAGVESNGGARKQEFLDSAKYYAADVINNGPYALLSSYEDLFRWNEKTGYHYDNNKESIFELQWVFSGPDVWGTANSMPEYLAYSNEIAYGGWGNSKGATWWILSLYDGLAAQPNGTMKGRTLDQRLHASFMLPGYSYPEITKKSDKSKFIYPFVDAGGGANYAAVKKYVIGGPDDLGSNAAQQHYPNDTYMMRLSELYLIYAEATIGNSPSTSDATAVANFNKVHMRAGLPEWLVVGGPSPNGPLTLDAVLNERFKEFAMEGMTWYDLVSLHYWNPQKALNIINNQDRGLYYVVPDKMPDPSEWTFTKTSWYADRMPVANEGNFVMPIPATELSQAPNLQLPPVEYK